MKEYQSLSHTRWDCKYHVVFIPKRRKKRIFGVLRRHLGELFHELASHKESKIVEGHLMGDHVHMCLSIPPKYAVSNVVGAIQFAKNKTTRERFADEAELTWHSRTVGFELGAIVRSTNGRLIVAPPLVMEHAQIDELIGRMREAVDTTAAKLVAEVG